DGGRCVQRGEFRMVSRWNAHSGQRAEGPRLDFVVLRRHLPGEHRGQVLKENCGHSWAGLESEGVARWKKDCLRERRRCEVFLLHECKNRGRARGWTNPA